jgi:transcriptional regulator with XRE-family HTH domain
MIGRYEDGSAVPNILTFTALADYFSVSADYLLGRQGVSMFYDKDKSCLFMPKELTDEDYDTLTSVANGLLERRIKEAKQGNP